MSSSFLGDAIVVVIVVIIPFIVVVVINSSLKLKLWRERKVVSLEIPKLMAMKNCV